MTSAFARIGVKVIPAPNCPAIKAYLVRGGKAPHVIHLGTRWIIGQNK